MVAAGVQGGRVNAVAPPAPVVPVAPDNLAYIIYMASLSPWLTVACLATTPLLWLMAAAFSRKIQPAYAHNRTLVEKMPLLHEDVVDEPGREALLVQVALPAVTAVETLSVQPVQPVHSGRELLPRRLDQQQVLAAQEPHL